jgi:hypothetical protein
MLVYVGGKYKYKYLAINIASVSTVQLFIGNEDTLPSLTISMSSPENYWVIDYDTVEDAESDMNMLLRMSGNF